MHKGDFHAKFHYGLTIATMCGCVHCFQCARLFRVDCPSLLSTSPFLLLPPLSLSLSLPLCPLWLINHVCFVTNNCWNNALKHWGGSGIHEFIRIYTVCCFDEKREFHIERCKLKGFYSQVVIYRIIGTINYWNFDFNVTDLWIQTLNLMKK